VRSDLEWALRQLGPAAALVRVKALPGGPHVRLHAIDVDNRGTRWKLVVRRYTDTVARDEPDIAKREARVLQLLDDVSDLRTPKLIAVDPEGREVGSPTVLMTRLDGHEQWKPPSIERFAAIAPIIHSVKAPKNFRRYESYFDFTTMKPPAWSAQPKLWDRAIAVAASARVDWNTTTFIHRDHHAGNVLWSRGRVSGVIDWEAAAIGPPAVDAARARMNLATQLGIAASRKYAKCNDIVVDPRWDIVDACDCGPGLLPGPYGVTSLEAFVADALSELG
jgi:aminoglycoside phosphotransferase (APT) family kinase protein